MASRGESGEQRFGEGLDVDNVREDVVDRLLRQDAVVGLGRSDKRLEEMLEGEGEREEIVSAERGLSLKLRTRDKLR